MCVCILCIRYEDVRGREIIMYGMYVPDVL
jgi:hypothetical protein